MPPLDRKALHTSSLLNIRFYSTLQSGASAKYKDIKGDMKQREIIVISIGVLWVTNDRKSNPNWLKQKKRKGIFYGLTKDPCWILLTGEAWFITMSLGPSFLLFLLWMGSKI